ncbi:hypothetical protein [Pseudosulfitobacter sp. DSM 107133]|uniref:hypothetical protein n=1 Tax=Pseudosulfitobacter sp. DSM 107133 TaxID=2883100 RepID=UPI001F0769EF|nr:hypothetical protein [Pseudosulfitobacter sp. DSM 107133]
MSDFPPTLKSQTPYFYGVPICSPDVFLWGCEVYLAVPICHSQALRHAHRHIFKADRPSGIFRAYLGSSGFKPQFLPAFPSLYTSPHRSPASPAHQSGYPAGPQCRDGQG